MIIDYLELRFAELADAYLAGLDGLRSSNARSICSRLEGGVSLLILLAPHSAELIFVPQFDSVWWRDARRWMRSFSGAEAVAQEIKNAERNGRTPFFRQATTWRKGRSVKTNDDGESIPYHEFVIPAAAVVEQQARNFLSEWMASFGDYCVLAADTQSDREQAIGPAYELLGSLPFFGQMPRLEPDEIEARLRALDDGAAEDLVRALFRGGGSPGLSFGDVDPDLPQRWSKVLDQRMSLLEQASIPEAYAWIQPQTSRSQWARDFVRESTPKPPLAVCFMAKF